jgi:hypothetical protein
LHVSYTHDGRNAYKIRDTAKILNSLKIEAAVLRIKKNPIEARAREKAWNLLGAQLPKSCAQLHLA